MNTWNVISIARRTLKNALTNPQILLPTMAFPLFFFTAFAGGLSQVSQVPGFDFPPGYTAFQFVFVLLQSAAFSGVFTGFGVARDFEGGFAKRLMLAAPRAGSSWDTRSLPLSAGHSSRCCSRSSRSPSGWTSAAAWSTSSGSSRSRLCSTSAASSGPAVSPCAFARSRRRRSCRCRSS